MNCISLTGDAIAASGSLVGVFSSRRLHFEGTLSISYADGREYAMPVASDLQDVPADF
jgi:hypothetical protein